MAHLFIVRMVGADDALPISVQLWLDDDRKAVPRGVTFGIYGGLSAKSEEICPFVLFPDGTMDQGTDVDPSERYWYCNIYLGRVVAEGEFFSVSDRSPERPSGANLENWEATTYRVLSVTAI